MKVSPGYYLSMQRWASGNFLAARQRQRNRASGTRKNVKNILVSVSGLSSHSKIAITNNFVA